MLASVFVNRINIPFRIISTIAFIDRKTECSLATMDCDEHVSSVFFACVSAFIYMWIYAYAYNVCICQAFYFCWSMFTLRGLFLLVESIFILFDSIRFVSFRPRSFSFALLAPQQFYLSFGHQFVQTVITKNKINKRSTSNYACHVPCYAWINIQRKRVLAIKVPSH